MRKSDLSPDPAPENNNRIFRSGEPIGLFDSGVGGLSAWRAVARELPQHHLIYFADQKFCPYGPRPSQEICDRSTRITGFLIEQNCRVIVVACNTASAVALHELRAQFPDIAFVGMEPAVKPAASGTRSGKIAVLATGATLNGELFANTRAQHANGVQVLTVYPTDWVERVERGDVDSIETLESVRSVIEPLLDAGVDEIALGCTHYPFLIPLIEKISQGRATILDPSDAVARQTGRVVRELKLLPVDAPTYSFNTSGDLAQFRHVLDSLMKRRLQAAVRAVAL